VLVLIGVFKIVIGVRFSVFLLKSSKWHNLTEKKKKHYGSIFIFILMFAVIDTLGFINILYEKSYSSLVFYLSIIIVLIAIVSVYLKIQEPYLSKALENGGLLWKDKT
jgi:hypothetical protein